MKHSKDIQNLLRPVYYFNEGVYYQVDSTSKSKLANKRGELKNFIVLDVTLSKIYYRDKFLKEMNLQESNSTEIIEFLDTLKYKVYRKIKCR